MRKFSSYGPISKDLHYYAPRTALIDDACQQILGDDPARDGHYITVWAPRQTGKTWLMQEVIAQIQAGDDFAVGFLSLQSAKSIEADDLLLRVFVQKLRDEFNQDFPDLQSWAELSNLFTATYFSKPVILILDEFDALQEPLINRFANEFRDMYSQRLRQTDRTTGEKSCLLHGLALIGVRSVLGIENISGSPFNVQRSVHIPNLMQAEVAAMFGWYAEESGQGVDVYMYLTRFLAELDGRVYPEFPTGNGQIDLVIHYAEQLYGLAVKSFVNQLEYTKNLQQAARDGKQLRLREITLAFFIEVVDDDNRQIFEVQYHDPETGVTVNPLFVVTG